MTLDEAIRQARFAIDAPHPAGYISDSTFVSRAVLRQVLDELAATSRGVVHPAATVAVIDYVRLRDQFAMHAPDELARQFVMSIEGDWRQRIADARYAYADAMMTARGTK